MKKILSSESTIRFPKYFSFAERKKKRGDINKNVQIKNNPMRILKEASYFQHEMQVSKMHIDSPKTFHNKIYLNSLRSSKNSEPKRCNEKGERGNVKIY